MTVQTPAQSRSRDAVKTRRSLLDAARRRFAYDGYSATTVRDIAHDAGVNVALINRYFESKEGLFAACLARAVEDLDGADQRPTTFDDMVQSLVTRVSDLPLGEAPLELLLLIRSSGDEQADVIRRETLDSYAEGMARIAGWNPDDPATEPLRLRAQIVLATAFGIVIMRSSTRLEPLASATKDDLAAPLGALMATLLESPAAP